MCKVESNICFVEIKKNVVICMKVRHFATLDIDILIITAIVARYSRLK